MAQPDSQILDIEAIRAQHVPKPDEGFGRWCDWCEMDWPCERVLLIAALDAVRADRDVLAAVGQMYLAALDDDPESEHLSLPDVIAVTMVREAVDRAAQYSTEEEKTQ